MVSTLTQDKFFSKVRHHVVYSEGEIPPIAKLMAQLDGVASFTLDVLVDVHLVDYPALKVCMSKLNCRAGWNHGNRGEKFLAFCRSITKKLFRAH